MSKPSAAKAARRARRKAKRPPRRFRSAGGVSIPTTWAEDFARPVGKIHWSPVGEATCSCCSEPVSMGRTDQTKCDHCEADDETTPESIGVVTITDSNGKKL